MNEADILPAPDLASPRFVQYWLRSWYHELREQSQGGAQPNWNAGLIKALPIVLPPLPDQRQVVAKFDALNDEIAKLQQMQAKARTELDALLPTIRPRLRRRPLSPRTEGRKALRGWRRPERDFTREG